MSPSGPAAEMASTATSSAPRGTTRGRRSTGGSLTEAARFGTDEGDSGRGVEDHGPYARCCPGRHRTLPGTTPGQPAGLADRGGGTRTAHARRAYEHHTLRFERRPMIR